MTGMTKRRIQRNGQILSAAVCLAIGPVAFGAASVSYTGGSYIQNFDSLPYTLNSGVNGAKVPTIGGTGGNPTTANTFTLPTGANNPWSLSQPAGNGVAVFASGLDGWWASGAVANQAGANDGGTTMTTGGLISYGGLTSSNRAIGLISTSSSGNEVFGLKLVNTSASTTYNSVNLSYTGELWHQGAAKSLTFGYLVDNTAAAALPLAPSIDGSAAVAQGTTAVAALNVSGFTTGAVAGVDGTNAANQQSKSVTSLAIPNWAPNGVLWLTWEMADGGSAQGLAIENLNFSAAASLIPPANVTWNLVTSGAWNTTTGNCTGGNPTTNLYKDTDNATFSNTAGGTITIAAGGVTPGSVAVSGVSGTYAFTGGSINGSGALTKSNGGTLVLGAGNGYSGGTVVTGGILQISNDNQLGASTGPVSLDTTGTLAITAPIASARNIVIGSGGATLAINGNIFSTSGTAGVNGLFTITGSAAVSLNGAATFGASGALSIPSGASVTLGQGTGTVVMANGGTFNGDLVISGTPRINFDSGTFAGTGTIKLPFLATTSTISAGGALSTASVLISNTSGIAGGTINSNILLNAANGAFTPGDITTTPYTPANYIATIGGTTGGGLVIGGVISGNSDLNIGNNSITGGGKGFLTLNAAANYTGNTLINTNGATITLNVANALPSSTSLLFNVLSGSAGTQTLDMAGHDLQVASLSTGTYGNAKITNSGTSDVTLTVGGAVNPAAAFGGVLADGATNKLALLKTGSNTLVLSGANTYTGGTTVSNGTLKLANASALATSGIVTLTGGTLDLNGNSTAPGATSVTAGTITNSSSTAATFTPAALTMTGAGSHLSLTLGGTAATSYDQVAVTTGPTTDITGASLALVLAPGYSPAINDTFDILRDASGITLSGNFAGLADNAIYTNPAGVKFRINYNVDGGDGSANDVVATVTAVPEPSTLMISSVVGLAGLLRRPRRRSGHRV